MTFLLKLKWSFSSYIRHQFTPHTNRINSLISQKLQLYCARLDGGAFKLLQSALQQLPNEQQMEELLDAVLPETTQFTAEQMAVSIQNSRVAARFDPLDVTTFVNLTDFIPQKYSHIEEIRARVQSARQRLVEVLQLDLAAEQLGFMAESPESLEPSLTTIQQAVLRPTSLTAAMNEPKAIHAAVCVLNGQQLDDGQSSIAFEVVQNYATPSSFISQQSVLLAVGYYDNAKFNAYAMCSVPVAYRPKVSNYKISVRQDGCFIVVKNIKNVEIIKAFVQARQPSFIVVLGHLPGDYPVIAGMTRGSSNALQAAKSIEEQLQTKCVFMACGDSSATSDQFEQVPIVDGFTTDPLLIKFGNSRILLTGRRCFQRVLAESREDPVPITQNNQTDLTREHPESDLTRCSPLVASYYLGFLHQESYVQGGARTNKSRMFAQYDCLVTAEDFQKFSYTYYGVKFANAVDASSGALVVGGMRGEVWTEYLEVSLE